MNISGIIYESVVDGVGIRNTIFVSGCRHGCALCHNKQTWDFNYGYEFTEDIQREFINKSKNNPLISGITLSGGDPMYSAKELLPFIIKYKQENPNHNIWIYSGFTYEEIMNDDMMKQLLLECDVLVDGLFMNNLKDLTLKFRGSLNQRIIDIKNSALNNITLIN